MVSSKIYKKNKQTIESMLKEGSFTLYTKRGNGDWVVDVSYETEGYYEIENHSKYFFAGYVVKQGLIHDVDMIIDNDFKLIIKARLENI